MIKNAAIGSGQLDGDDAVAHSDISQKMFICDKTSCLNCL